MKKLINQPSHYVDDALAGMLAAHPGVFAASGSSGRVITRAHPKPKGGVGLVTGGGFGHLPLFAGYVGEGLLDSCAVGDVFAGPSRDSVLEALKVADGGAGVLAIIGNYGGDRMVFSMAAEARRSGGHRVEVVIGNDDVASASEAESASRRGGGRIDPCVQSRRSGGRSGPVVGALSDGGSTHDPWLPDDRGRVVALHPASTGQADFRDRR